MRRNAHTRLLAQGAALLIIAWVIIAWASSAAAQTSAPTSAPTADKAAADKAAANKAAANKAAANKPTVGRAATPAKSGSGKWWEGPLIPYIKIPTPKPFGLPIQPFGVLVGLGLVIGYFLGQRRARLTGLDPNVCADGMVWTVVGGFIIAHLVSVIFYFPDKIIKNPLVLLMFWAGLSSFGGFLGGALGAWAFFYRKMKVSFLAYADAIIFGLIPGWVFGRMGCSVVHDHPGLPTNFFLAVKFPDGARHDLGFYEMLYTIVLTGVIYAFKNVRPFFGFHPAMMLFLYAPVRFMFDYLRTADKRYVGLTPGQYFAIAMALGGLALVVYGTRLRRKGIAPRLQPLAGEIVAERFEIRKRLHDETFGVGRYWAFDATKKVHCLVRVGPTRSDYELLASVPSRYELVEYRGEIDDLSEFAAQDKSKNKTCPVRLGPDDAFEVIEDGPGKKKRKKS